MKKILLFPFALLLSPVLLVVAGGLLIVTLLFRFLAFLCTESVGILIDPFAPDMDQ